MTEQAVDAMDVPWYKLTKFYLTMLAGAVLVYVILHWLWGNIMQTSITALLGHGLVWAGLGSVWFIFVWAFAVTTLIAFWRWRQGRVRFELDGERIGKGLWVSLNAGVFEELIFRVFIFLNMMVVLTFLNFITFGVVSWVYHAILLPVANFTTFHALAPQLIGHGWLFGAAIVSSCARFRKGHAHHGWFGTINAWFMGMILFWLVFNYGLLTAIVAHILYDAIVLTIDGSLEKVNTMIQLQELLKTRGKTV